MKQKYNITVADLELNIVSDASPEEVQTAVGALDKRIRDIRLKSPRCSKTEAAILCALSYGSEKAAMQTTFRKMERDSLRFTGEIDRLKHQLEVSQAENRKLWEELKALKNGGSSSREPSEPSSVSPQRMQPELPQSAGESDRNLEELQKRNRVDGMYRLLTNRDENHES